MDTSVMKQIRGGLAAKRDRLADWLHATPPAKRQAQLGPAGEQEVVQCLQALNEAADAACSPELGLCEVCQDYVEPALLQMDYTSSVCLDHFSDAERRTLEAELELAQAVQRSLLPQEVPDTPYLQLAAFSRPAQIIGGDYFGFYRFQDGAEALAIADVAGHGVSASLHMAGVHALLETLIATSTSPAAVLEHVHRLFVHNAGFSTFVTAFLAAYDPHKQTLTYCNAGHNAPLLVHDAGRSESEPCWLRPTAPAVGLIEWAEFRVATVEVLPGDTLLLYTDGVTEARDRAGTDFGNERLAAALQRNAGLSAREILQNLRREFEEFVDGEPLEDDTTLVVCKILG